MKSNFILLSIQADCKFFLYASSVGEIERIRDRLSVGDLEYELESGIVIKNIVAYGKTLEITERECKSLIPPKTTIWYNEFRCYSRPEIITSPSQWAKLNTNDCYDCDHIHFTAKESWACAWQAVGEPDLAILVKEQINIRNYLMQEDVTDNDYY